MRYMELISVLNKERNDCCGFVQNQNLTLWEWLNTSYGDGCLWRMCSYPCGFLRIECECVRYECYELIISIHQLFINSEIDCWRVFITTQWFTMTKDTDYNFEYNLPNHLHLIINTPIHSHLMLSESSLSQRNTQGECWKQSIEAHLHFNSFQSTTFQSHFIHVSEVILIFIAIQISI